MWRATILKPGVMALPPAPARDCGELVQMWGGFFRFALHHQGVAQRILNIRNVRPKILETERDPVFGYGLFPFVAAYQRAAQVEVGDPIAWRDGNCLAEMFHSRKSITVLQ